MIGVSSFMHSDLSQSQTPVYNDYNDRDDQHELYGDDNDSYHNDYPVQDDNGRQRVLRLVVILAIIIVIASLLIFGLIPYIETFTQNSVPPLPPAVQT